MGEATISRKVQVVLVAAFAAVALGFVLTSGQVAYADDGQYQTGVLTVQSGTEVEAGKGATKAEYTVVSSSKKTVTYTQTETTGTTAKVPDTVKINGKSYKVTGIDAGAFKGNTKIKKVTVGKYVTTIAQNAFKGCKKLTTVTLGAKVTTIGKQCFANCSKLTGLKLGANTKTIKASAFSGAKKLKTLTINSKKLTKASISKALKGSSIKTVKVPKAKVKAYKKIFTKANCGKKVTVKKI